uniref:hypothetical protein n=1 Tax=Salmonella enterica TaxID=28901 RepID=UPI003298D96E
LGNITDAVVNVGTLIAGDANADTEARDKTDGVYQIPLSTEEGKRTGSREFVLAVSDAVNENGTKRFPLDVRMNC